MLKLNHIVTIFIFIGLILQSFIGCYKNEKHPNVLVVSFNGGYESFNFDNTFYFNRTYKASPIEDLYESSILSGKYYNTDQNLIEYTANLFNRNDYSVRFIGEWANLNGVTDSVLDKIPLDEVNPYNPFAFFITCSQLDTVSIDSQKYEVEKLLTRLKALKILDNTIMYISYNNLSKGGMKESDIKICSELVYPDLITNERSSNYLVSSTDILPTILDLCNINGIDYSIFDGISLKTYILEDEIPRRQAVIVTDSLRETIVTSNWKYIAVSDSIDLNDSSIQVEELYNLDTDPSEQNNLANQARFISKKIELQNLLKDIQR